ncbi:FIG00956680: hypothetical protein [Pseudomonas sp. SHC52]|nr:FIG00956680: hypothetical protein [Pseudomonas sp. SHC52]
MLFACQCHGNKPRRIVGCGRFLLLPIRQSLAKKAARWPGGRAYKSVQAGRRRDERWARGESEQVEANCGRIRASWALVRTQSDAGLPSYASVPRDNFVPVATSSNTPCGQYRHESACGVGASGDPKALARAPD